MEWNRHDENDKITKLSTHVEIVSKFVNKSLHILVQLGFSSNVTSDTVALTNFFKNFNFCGRLCFDSLVAKPLSNLYDDSSSNFWQSNDWQKVQYNTDLLKQKWGYLHRN